MLRNILLLCAILFISSELLCVEGATSKNLANSTHFLPPVVGTARLSRNYADTDVEDESSRNEKKLTLPEGKTDKNAVEVTDTKGRSCTGSGGVSGAPSITPDISSLVAGGAGIIEAIVGVIIVLAIIWIKIIAIGVIIYWWIGSKGETGGGGGYGYGPSKPVYGPPQPQYGTPSGYSSRSLTESLPSLETVGEYVWKAIDYFTELNDRDNGKSLSSAESKMN